MCVCHIHCSIEHNAQCKYSFVVPSLFFSLFSLSNNIFVGTNDVVIAEADASVAVQFDIDALDFSTGFENHPQRIQFNGTVIS